MTWTIATRTPLAYKDEAFLDSDDARPLRILAEYLQPLHAFRREQRSADTIVFFGSARLARRRAARPLLRRGARARAPRHRCGRRACLADVRRYVVCTGGGGGIMEAANRGAADAGGRVDRPQHRPAARAAAEPATSRRSSTFEFHYFFMRKLWFAHLARALVVFPGGFGTLDELIEILTLMQTRKLAAAAFRSCSTDALLERDHRLRGARPPRHDRRRGPGLFRFADDPPTALELLQPGIASKRSRNPARTPDFAHSQFPPGTAG